MTFFRSSAYLHPSPKITCLQSFPSKLLFQGIIEQNHLSKNVKSFRFRTIQRKYLFQYWISIKKQLMTCYSTLQFILLKQPINISLNWKNAPEVTLTEANRTRNKFFEIVAFAEYYLIILIYKIRNQEAAVPNTPSSEIRLWTNNNQKGKNVSNSQHSEFEQS